MPENEAPEQGELFPEVAADRAAAAEREREEAADLLEPDTGEPVG